MARRPKDEPLELQYHDLAPRESPAWHQWFEHGDPKGLVILLPSPPDGTAKARTAEHEKIFARLEAGRRLYLRERIGRIGAKLRRRRPNDPAKYGDRYSLEVIATFLSENFKRPVSASQAGQVIREYEHGNLSQWPTTDTRSINDLGIRPRHPRRN